MDEITIQVRNLGKQFRIGQLEHHKTLRDAIVRGVTAPFRSRSTASGPGGGRQAHEYIWALRNISFEVQKGEAVGIIGRNGAGKSTLLKILSRITEPTEGMAEIRGRVGSLLEVGTGFHPELTGRENIYLNGAILGMTRAEIERKFDEIVAFSEIERFLDTPVKRYSSGMYVRLAFAVAAHLEPEILLVDEVLAVGDIAFQRKCLGKMEDVTEEGRTVLFVSHNMTSIQALTEKAICLDGGRIVASGPTEETVQTYLALMDAVTPSGRGDLSKHKGVEFLKSVEILQNGKPVSVIRIGTPITFRLKLTAPRPLKQPSLGVAIESEQGARIVGFSTLYDIPNLPPLVGEWTAYCDAGVLPLNQGTFYLKVGITDGPEDLDEIERACKFEVVPDDIFGTGYAPSARQGMIVWHGKWRLESATEAITSPSKR
jgi:lipopolysaccharide transport system ATP-binding protein